MQASLMDPAAADSAGGAVLLAASAAHETGRETAPHHHARGQAFGALRGLLTVVTEQGRWVVPATHAVWIPPHRLHGVQAHGPFVGWSAYVAESACADLPGEPFTMRMSDLLRAAILRAVDWDGSPLLPAQAHVAQVVLDEIRQLPRQPLGLPMPRDARLLRIANGIVAAPGDDRGLPQWAEAAGLAPRTASRGFRQETGFGFAEWRQRARVLQALEWLAAGKAVTTIALDLGYDNVSAFIAMFRRLLGSTPGRYFDDEAVGRG